MASHVQALATISSTASQLQTLVQHQDAAILAKRPRTGKWSVAEIVAHLSDAEVVSSFRLRQILTQPDGTPISGYDQDAWAHLADYASIPVDESLQKFSVLRAANVRLMNGLSEDQLDRYGVHAERGPESVRALMQIIANHDVNHMLQIRTILGNPAGPSST